MLNKENVIRETDGKLPVEVNSSEIGKDRVVGLMKEKTIRELKTEGRLRAKYINKDAKKIINKEIAEQNKIKKEEKAKMDKYCKDNNAVYYYELNESELETLLIIDEAEAIGIKLSVKEARLIKKEIRKIEMIGSKKKAKRYFKTMEARMGSKMAGVIFVLVIWIIKAKCPMPKNARAYQVKAKALAKAQTDNTLGYFSPPFIGLALMITNVGDLLTAIEAFEDPTLIGTIEDVEAAMALVKISVDELIAYVNSIVVRRQTDAPSIIVNAGMEQVKEKQKNTKADFSIRQGEGTGNIVLTSLAGRFDGKRVPTTYYWQYGLIVAGVMVWYDLPDTVNECKTIATGMSTTQSVSFRKATKTKKGGRSAWSPPIAISPA